MDGRWCGRWTAVLLLAAVAGCDDPTTPVEPITGPGDYERSFGFGGAERGYELHVPASVDLGSPSPLVLVFHGVPRAAGMRVYTGFDAVADEQGFVVAYMLAHPRHGDWAVGCPLCTNAEAAGVDDVGYVRAALDRIGRELPVDEGRVYAAGFSQGAVFAQRLGCDLSGRVVAIASVAATMIEAVAQRCDPSPPVSALFVHGTEDLEFPWDGSVGSTVRLLSAPAMVDAWAGIVGCDGASAPVMLPDTADDGTTVTRTERTGCDGGADVVFYAVDGGGHTWPGSPAEFSPALGTKSRDLDASRTIGEWFLGRRR